VREFLDQFSASLRLRSSSLYGDGAIDERGEFVSTVEGPFDCGVIGSANLRWKYREAKDGVLLSIEADRLDETPLAGWRETVHEFDFALRQPVLTTATLM
jgi:hypothetical protein